MHFSPVLSFCKLSLPWKFRILSCGTSENNRKVYFLWFAYFEEEKKTLNKSLIH